MSLIVIKGKWKSGMSWFVSDLKHAETFNEYYKPQGQFWLDGVNDYWIKYSYNLRNRYIVKIVEELKPTKILDLGCGTGDVSLLLKHPDRKIWGIDPAEINVQRYEQNTGLTCFLGYAENLPLYEDSFDMVIIADVIEHVIDPQKAIDEVFRILKKGGYLVLTTPNKYSEMFWSLFNLRLFKKQSVKDDLFTPKRLKKLFKNRELGHVIIDFSPRSRIISKLCNPKSYIVKKILWFIERLGFLNYRQIVLVKK